MHFQMIVKKKMNPNAENPKIVIEAPRAQGGACGARSGQKEQIEKLLEKVERNRRRRLIIFVVCIS